MRKFETGINAGKFEIRNRNQDLENSKQEDLKMFSDYPAFLRFRISNFVLFSSYIKKYCVPE